MHRTRGSGWIAVAAAGVLSAMVLAGCRNDDALTELRDQQRQILTKLTALEEKIDKVRTAAATLPPRPVGPDPARAYSLPLGKSPSKGPEKSAITIVEFSDYQCPYCAKSEPLIKSFLDVYPKDTRVVFKHFPLVSIHPHAMPAALAAAAAQKQGKFWQMHELLFANQHALSSEQITQLAKQIGLDTAKFEADMKSDEVKAAVQEDVQLAQQVGVRGTPTIFVNGKLLQTRTVEGFKALADPAVGQKAPAQQKDG
jgi:protein-disulfide isomerase